VIIEREVDCGAVYERERRRLITVVGSVAASDLETLVPATPVWTVRDVLAHLVGIAADLNARRFGDGDSDEWTAAQVRSRCGRSVDELAAEWDVEAPLFEDGLRSLGYEIGSHFVGDLLQHVLDVHDAMGRQWPVDDEALTVALDFYLDVFHCALTAAGVGSVAVRADEFECTVGSGPIVASLTTSRVTLLRCLGGRSNDGEMRGLQWTGDVERVLGFVSAYPPAAS
jgi:uncharacterized protein (TIGR03083 family)